MIDLNPTGIPDELKRTHRWVLWVLCDVQDGSKLRKSCKVPFDAKDGSPASHSDLNTWASFDVALAAHESNLKLTPPDNVVTMYDTCGIGMVLGKPFFGKDFDKCIVDGVMDSEVEAELAELNTYADVSQSGTGVHVIGHGEPPYLDGHRKDNREIYSCNRFFVMTGNIVGDYKEVRRFTPVEVAAMYAKVKVGKKEFKPLSVKLEELMTSIDFPDKSEAVMSLLTQLAYQNGDPSFIDAEFKKSKLYSDTHWCERWPRLGAKQIAKAIAWVNTHPRREPAAEMELVVSDADKAEVKKTTWLWKGWLSRGDVHGSFGDSKEGKSPVWTDIAAVLTTGRAFPDGAVNENGSVNVILCNSEDSFERKTLPRFLAAGGDATRLKHIDGVRPKGSSLRARVLALDESIEVIRKYLQEQKEQGREFALLVFDPITSFLGRMKYTDHQQTRRVMDPLADLAEEFKLAVVIVNHFNRNTQTTSAQYRTLGGGLYQVCRQVLLHTRPEDADVTNGEERYRHVLSEDRNQEVDSIEYSTVKKLLTLNGDEFDVIQIVWGKKIETKSDAMMDQTSNQDKGIVSKLAAELGRYLTGKRDGDLASKCVEYLESCFPEIKGRKEFKWDRVRKKAGITTGKDGKANRWCLPHEAKIGNLFEPTPERIKRTKELKKDDAPEY